MSPAIETLRVEVDVPRWSAFRSHRWLGKLLGTRLGLSQRRFALLLSDDGSIGIPWRVRPEGVRTADDLAAIGTCLLEAGLPGDLLFHDTAWRLNTRMRRAQEIPRCLIFSRELATEIRSPSAHVLMQMKVDPRISITLAGNAGASR